ncbi:MAG: glycosyl hydrolase [Pirellulales bacterium]
MTRLSSVARSARCSQQANRNFHRRKPGGRSGRRIEAVGADVSPPSRRGIRDWWLPVTAGVVAALLMTAMASATPIDDAVTLKKQFARPSRDFSTGPLWVWNDWLTEEEIRSTLGDLASQHVQQVWVHPRPGLMTPYLGPDWFRMWKIALDEAKRLDMNVWIYDENSYPSGFAGGLVPEALPQSRGQGVHFRETERPPAIDPLTLAIYRLEGQRYENVIELVRAGKELPKATYLVAEIRMAPQRGWFGGKFYVDLLRPGVTEKFLEITLGAYQREIGQYFGGHVPGCFTDEPHLAPAGGLHWSDTLAARFQQRWGYDLVEHLPSLVRPLGDWKRVRHNYQQFLLEEFIEHWSKPYYEYCEAHDLEFTGHYWEHGWPGASHGGDNMAMYAWHQRPAIDNLMNEYSRGVHGQFGNSRTVRELASVANQLGRERTLCETYGAGGWDLRFEDMKRIGDWLYVLGVNTLNQHLSYITIRGARKRDHPLSFSYHQPWWDNYHLQADYFARLSLVMSAGQQVNHVLLLEPTTTAWMYQPDASARKQLDGLGDSFQELTHRLEAAQAEYDIGSEDILRRHGHAEVGDENKLTRLVVGERGYDLIVLPPFTENMNGPTADLLEKYVDGGGQVLCCGEPPTLVDGRPTDRFARLVRSDGWKRGTVDEAIATMRQASTEGLSVQRAAGDRGLLFHHRRRLKDGQIVLLVNTSIDAPSAGTFNTSARGVERWDAATGQVVSYPFEPTDEGVRATFHLPPCGSLLLMLTNDPRPAVEEKLAESTTIRPQGPPAIRRLEPNVLLIDYVDVEAGGERLERAYFYPAQQFVFQQNGMERNPWDSQVQFRDELITKTFPEKSGFEATYRFTIEGDVPQPLEIVIERPDLYTITCNGQRVVPEPGAWWLDKSFGKIDLSRVARTGPNTVMLWAEPFTLYHELEPAYVRGDFRLKPTDAGFTIVPPRPLQLGRTA